MFSLFPDKNQDLPFPRPGYSRDSMTPQVNFILPNFTGNNTNLRVNYFSTVALRSIEFFFP